MIKLTKEEQVTALKIRKLKEASGSHSPSIFTLKEELATLNIKVDACFLSNPYATDLFMKYLKKELIETDELRNILEFYPSQNNVLADFISKTIKISKENIFVGNGAIEIIQAVLHKFVENKIIVNIPTFSSYYEFIRDDTEVIYYQLDKENNYMLNIDKYLKFIKKNKPDSIVLINPNNPNGGYLKYEELKHILNNLKELKNIIIDESFIHFAFEDSEYNLISTTELFKEFSNVIIIKSMSKDFGIAGIRAGYAVMNKNKILNLLKNGYLWNSSGLSEYFFRLYMKNKFIEDYEIVRKRYILEAQDFFSKLSKIKELKVYPSMANFALIELLDGSSSSNFVSKMLIKYGIYTRTGNDKIGLNGEFIRIASRSKDENKIILESIEDMFHNIK